MLNVVEEVFAEDLLKLSGPASEIVDFVWTLYKMNSFTPVRIITQFSDIEEKINALSRMGIIAWSTAGVGKDFSIESMSVALSEDFKLLFEGEVSRASIKDVLFRQYGKDLIKMCRTDLTKIIIYMLSSIIKRATPEKPILDSRIARIVSGIGLKSFEESKAILDFYIRNFLELIEYKGSFLNLSQKSRDIIKKNPHLWVVYNTEYQDKAIEKIEEDERRTEEIIKANVVQKKMRGYFPWMKL